MKVGPEYQNSREQRCIDLAFAHALWPIKVTAGIVAAATFGYGIHTDERIGQNGKKITIPKIVTLHHGGTPLSKLADTYRSKGIDELPQIDLILSGVMSAFGPRHLLENEVDRIEDVAQRSPRGRSLLAEHHDLVDPMKRGLFSTYGFASHGGENGGVLSRLEMNIADAKKQSIPYNVRMLLLGSRGLLASELSQLQA